MNVSGALEDNTGKTSHRLEIFKISVEAKEII